jgi:hypothetical protein
MIQLLEIDDRNLMGIRDHDCLACPADPACAPGLVDASILCPADQKLTGHLAVRTKNLISISVQKIFTAGEGW